MKWQFLLVAVAGGLLAADAPKDAPAKPDQEQMQGSWVLVSAERGGKAADELKDSQLEVAGDKLTVSAKGKKEESIRFKLDSTKKPRQIDLLAGPEAIPGIYSLEGDTLKICFDKEGGKVRPTEFATKGQANWALMVFKRAKK